MNDREVNGHYSSPLPNSLFACMDYSFDVMSDNSDLSNGHVKTNGNVGVVHHVKNEARMKLEPSSTPGTPKSASSFSWPAPTFSHVCPPPPAYNSNNTTNGMVRPPTASSVPLFGPQQQQQQQQQQTSPNSSAMPADSTSNFLQFAYRRTVDDSNELPAFEHESCSPIPSYFVPPDFAGSFNNDPRRQTEGFIAAADSSATTSNGMLIGTATTLSGLSSQSQKAFIPCKVCGDKASGYHYGVTSCEGCKGFFRRSIQKQIEYRCLRDGRCMVFRLNRNRCQYCRFKKCLAVGMSRDSVRYGRVPKRSRERPPDETKVTSMTEDSEVDSEQEKRHLAIYDIILSVSQAHHTNCNYTDDKIKNLAHRPMIFPLDQLHDESNSTGFLERQKLVMWQTLSAKILPEIQQVVEFAKRIPGFADLEQEDQLILIKGGFFEIWLVRLARMFNPQTFSLTFSDGCVISRNHLEIIYTAELVSSMMSFTALFNNLHLNDGEIGIFSAIVLMTHDRPKLRNPTAVEQLQEKLVEALRLQLSRSRSSDPQICTTLFLKLADLRTVGCKHLEVLEWFQMNSNRMTLPALYAEIYNIHPAEHVIEYQQNNDNNNNNNNNNAANDLAPPPPYVDFVPALQV